MRRKIMLWLWRNERPDWMVRIIFDTLTTPVSRICCFIWGHEPERDQCNGPEHDFCLWCLKSMPGKAAR